MSSIAENLCTFPATPAYPHHRYVVALASPKYVGDHLLPLHLLPRPLFYAPPVQTINNTIESYPFQPLPDCPVTVTVNDDDTIYVLEEEESDTTLWRHKVVMCVATPVRPFRDRDLPLVLHLNILVAYFGVQEIYRGIEIILINYIHAEEPTNEFGDPIRK